MFGYIRPVQGELLVREHELYRATYCGLCRYSGKNLTHFSRFLLNYDFVALAMLRLALSGEQPVTCKKRCPYSTKKRNTLIADDTYALTAAAFGILTFYKVIDDINDTKGFKRFLYRLALPFFRRIKNKVQGYAELEAKIKDALHRLSESESADRVKSLDEVSDHFADITRYIASYGLEGKNAAIASECGYHIGRYIYLIDALDDLFEDSDNSEFNPLISFYGTVDAVISHLDEVKTTITDSLNAFSGAFGLITVSRDPERTDDYDNIIFNICDLGGRAALNKVLSSEGFTKAKELHSERSI